MATQFVQRYIATVGVDYGVKPTVIRGTTVRVNFWDLSGRPEFFEVRNEFYKDAQGVRHESAVLGWGICLIVCVVGSCACLALRVHRFSDFTPPKHVAVLFSCTTVCVRIGNSGVRHGISREF